jgi:hypothetical protein
MELFDAYQAPRDEVRDEIKEEILAPAVKGRKVWCGEALSQIAITLSVNLQNHHAFVQVFSAFSPLVL